MSAMIDAQATRLVASGSASNSTAVMGFMNGWLGLPRLFTTAKDTTVYTMSATTQNEMQTESQDLIMEAFNGSGTFGSVLTADHSFLNKDLATFYGFPTSVTNGLGTVVHQRQVRLGDHPRSGAPGDRDDPERLRAPQHRLAHPARPHDSLADALPGHHAAAAGARHDVHAVDDRRDDPRSLHQRARAGANASAATS